MFNNNGTTVLPALAPSRLHAPKPFLQHGPVHEAHRMKSRQDTITARDRLRQWKLLHVGVGSSQLSDVWSACLIMNRFSQSIISGISPLPWNAAAEVSGPQAVVSCLLFLSAFSFSPWKIIWEREGEREREISSEKTQALRTADS